MTPVFLTADGRVRLVERIEATRAAYLAVCADNPDALQSGDSSGWHDNFAFEENQRQMHQLARRVRDLEDLLTRVRVVAPPSSFGRVAVGTRVTWCVDASDDERTAIIAGYDDGDPACGRVSYNSPLGAALVGAAEGDVRTFEHEGRRFELEVIAIGPAGSGP